MGGIKKMDAEKKKRYENISAEVVKLAGGRDNYPWHSPLCDTSASRPGGQ